MTKDQNRQSAVGKNILETILRDIRYGVRSLLGRPGFRAIAVITLAVGIGANTVEESSPMTFSAGRICK
jgi:hypothetical protein